MVELLSKFHGTKYRLSTAYVSETNGTGESIFKHTLCFLRAFSVEFKVPEVDRVGDWVTDPR